MATKQLTLPGEFQKAFPRLPALCSGASTQGNLPENAVGVRVDAGKTRAHSDRHPVCFLKKSSGRTPERRTAKTFAATKKIHRPGPGMRQRNKIAFC